MSHGYDECPFPPPPYCDYCEHEGHTFSTCPARDDEFLEDD